MKDIRTVNVYGETVEINWDGNVWRTANGSPYASARDAMRHELEDFFAASGDDIEDDEIGDLIENLLDEMK